MKKALLLILSLSAMFSLMGCTSNVPKSNSSPPQNNSNQTTNTVADDLEINEKKKLSPLRLEVPDKEDVHVEIEKFPVLMSYLAQTDDPQLEISRFRSTHILTYQHKNYFLIGYNCGVKLCDQLLVENNQDEIKSIEVSKSSYLQNTKQQENYLALLFGRNEGAEVVRNQVALFNLKEFEKVLPPNQLEALESFEYPITCIEWEGKNLRANIANIKETTYENIKKWNENKKEPILELVWELK